MEYNIFKQILKELPPAIIIVPDNPEDEEIARQLNLLIKHGDDRDDMEEIEYNLSGVRFLPNESAKLYDPAGNEIMCKCGKSATNAVIGKEAFIAKCNECMYGKD